MQKISLLLATLFLFLLAGCAGSDTYRGAWKAMDGNGQKFELVFEAKKFTVKDTTGKITSFDYTQNQVSIKNSIATYGIELKDGRTYQINFPVKNDESKALILDQSDRPVYTISRTGYMKYEDMFKLQ